ncbi:hypothetical protein a10_07930 [Streptomyces acidiscabies]|nr:hypothetical protein a10_07930 [Streptomyces acidiscabies]
MGRWVSLGQAFGGFSESLVLEPQPKPGTEPVPRRAVEEEPKEARAAADTMRAAGYEPEEPYPGRRSSPWRVRCTTCKKPRRPTLHQVACGLRCKHGGRPKS